MKLKIINQNYVHAPGVGGRLQPASYTDNKPWAAIGYGNIKLFPTHAESIAYADELARGWGEVP